MKNSPSITIAIPSYNKASYLCRCIDSALKNMEAGVDIILVDNASSDATYAIAKSYEPNITCYQNDSNIGMASNWNKCIEHATGDWILILHADDELVPDVIPLYRSMIAKYPDLGIIHANSFGVTNGNIATMTITATTHKEHWHAGAEALDAPIGLCSTVMVKKEAYEKLGNFISTSLSADGEMWPRIASRYDLAFINTPTAIYHSNESSTGTHSLIERRFEDIVADWDNLTEQTANAYPTEALRQEYLTRTKKDAVGNYWAIISANIKARKYRNVVRAVWIISVHYKELLPFMRLVIVKIWNKL